jgi:UrcA family protein
MNLFATTSLIIALGFASQLANAAPPQETPVVVVRFADLDLSHSDGVAQLYQRLQGAAEVVCAAQNGRNGSDLGYQTRYTICRQSALAAAVTKVDQPALTAYHRAKVGGNAAIQIAQK